MATIALVGAGPGGLASAMRLAAAGHRVTVYEAHARVGGRMRGFDEGPYGFDTGPTILQVPRVYDQLFADCGLNRESYVQFRRVSPNTRLRFWDDSVLDLTSDLEAFRVQLAALRPDLPARFDRWYMEHIQKNIVGYEPYLGTPVRSIPGYLNPLELAAALPFRPWESLYQHFWRHFADERVVYALSYPSKYLGMHPTRCSSVFSLIAFLEFADGIWHPVGGFRALAQALARAAQDLGVTIHCDAPVKRVVTTNGRASGLELASGERIAADLVVVNADFAHGMRHLLDERDRGRYTDDRLEKLHFSCSTFMIYLGVNRRYEDLPHHQLYLSRHILRRDRPYIDDSALDDVDPPFYVCNPSVIDPSNAPDGHSTLFVLVPIPNTRYGVDWAAHEQRYRDLIIERLPLLGYHDVAAHIVSETRYTAQTWQDAFAVHLGAVFNLSHGWTQLGPFRPHIRSDAVRGLYWVGGAVHPGSGLLTILEAAKSTAHFVAQDLAAT